MTAGGSGTAKNASATLVTMACISITMFVGIKGALLFRPRVVVTSVPFHLDR